MALEVGEAVVKLKFDGSGVKTGVAEVEKETEAFGTRAVAKFGDVGKKITAAFTAGTAAATAAVTALTKKIVDSYGDYEQLYGGVETLFKDSAAEIYKYATDAYKTAGLSSNEYMETVTSFSASLLQGLGGDTDKAAKIANRAITDMSDNANKMGTSMEAIQNAYQGFAKQNYTMLDNLKLGYGGTASEMARLINDSGVLGETVKITAQDVNSVSFDKIIEAIGITQDRIGITGTTAKEAAETIQGSIGQMRAAWKNLVTVMGDTEADPTAVLKDLVDSVKNVAKNLMPVAKIALANIAGLLQEIGPMVVEGLAEVIPQILPTVVQTATDFVGSILTLLVENLSPLLMSIVPPVMTALMEFVASFVAYLPQFLQGVIDLTMMLVEALVPQLPTLLQAVITGVVGVVQTLTKPENLKKVLAVGVLLLTTLVEAVPEVIVALMEALPSVIENIVSFLTNPENIGMLIGAGVKLFFGLVEAVPQILGSLVGAFTNVIGSLWSKLTGLFSDFAGNLGSTIGQVFKNAINGVLSFIESFINGPIDLLNMFVDTVNVALGWTGLRLWRIPRVRLFRLAEGGAASSATPAIFGEAGTEVVLPLEQNQDNWAGLLASTLADEMREQGETTGSPITIYMTNEINSSLDIQEVSQGLMEEVRRAA